MANTPRKKPGTSKGAGKSPAKAGAGTGQTSKPGKPGKNSKTGNAPRQHRGPKAFGNERFGSNLGARKGPAARPAKQSNQAKPSKKASKPAPRMEATAGFDEVNDPNGVRLQKVMAQAGVASRRACEEMILEGRVEIDGKIVTELGVRVDPYSSTIHVDGIRLQLNDQTRYYAFNKPQGVVSTMDDPEGRPSITDYLKPKRNERLFHIGRLDVATEGLLLLTNDGELANRLSHPKYEVPKTYLVQVRGPMPHGIGAQLREGIELEDGVTKVDSFKLVDSTPGKVLVEVVLHSGKNRIVRRLFDAVGFPVQRLVRIKFGPITLGNQKPGSIRPLGKQEIGHLLADVGL